MKHLLAVRTAIYDQFQGSCAGPSYFFKPHNADAYSAYYHSMYLIQDTGESVDAHMCMGFASSPLKAYLEFWGVMQAIAIQQDAILELHKAVVGNRLIIHPGTAWDEIRNLRHLCAGHPAKRSQGVPAPQRTFMGRSFGNYGSIRYELWDARTGQITHAVVDLRQMIHDYDREAAATLNSILSTMKSKWP